MNAESLPLTITEEDRDAPPASCFLPGTNIQYAWDSTSLGYLKRCPRFYQYVMIEGWQPKDESLHLRFGQEVHSCFEDFDRALAEGCEFPTAFRIAIHNLVKRTEGWDVDRETKAGKYKNRDSLIRTCIDYLDNFRQDTAEPYILEDGRPAVELSFRFELDWGPASQYRSVHERDWDAADRDEEHNAEAQPYLLCGHLDKVVTYSGHLFVMDRKTTTKTLGSYYFNQFEPDNQMTLYTLASRIILNAPIRGVIIDGIQILVDSTRFDRSITYRTPDQLEEWLGDLRYWLTQAEAYATDGYWPMNDTSCDKYGGCQFRDICSKSPSSRPMFMKSSFIQVEESERWNPMKPR